MKTYQAAEATDRHKSPETKTYRQLTSAEVRNGMQHFLFIGRDGKIRNCRASGQLKAWKTRPSDYRLPIKYGLYESSALVPDHVDPSLATFEGENGAIPVVKVAEQTTKVCPTCDAGDPTSLLTLADCECEVAS